MIISILGCGWLGLPLAEHFRNSGHTVKGSTTSPDKLELLKGKEITPFLLELDPAPSGDQQAFWEADQLIIAIPPSRGSDSAHNYYLQQLREVAQKASKNGISHVLFSSSTSVYPPEAGVVDEVDARPGEAARPTGNLLLEAEELLISQPDFETTVIRFGGLYGYDRHPVYSLSGRKELEKGDAPINLIHRDDCIGIVERIIEKQATGEIYNGVSDGHPPRKMYYPIIAEKLGVEPPVFKEHERTTSKGEQPNSSNGEQNYKVVSNRKVKQMLQYKFKYPNPMDF